MTQIKAINKKHQSTINRAIKHLIKYNELNNLRDLADNNDDEKLYNKYNRMCENRFDKYEETISELPSREINQIENSNIY